MAQASKSLSAVGCSNYQAVVVGGYCHGGKFRRTDCLCAGNYFLRKQLIRKDRRDLGFFVVVDKGDKEGDSEWEERHKKLYACYLCVARRNLSLLFAPIYGDLSLAFTPALASSKTFRFYLPRPFRLQATFREPFAPVCPGLWNLALLFAPTFYPVLGPFALICPGAAGLGIPVKSDFRSYLPRP